MRNTQFWAIWTENNSYKNEWNVKTVLKNALCSISCIKLCMRRSFSFSSLSVFHVFKAMTSLNSTQYWFWFRAWNSLNGLKSKHYFPYSVCNSIVVCRTYPDKNLVEFRKIFNMSKFKWKMYNVREDRCISVWNRKRSYFTLLKI